ncbi:MAG TPA: outer membrane beta-barrel protein, partial [Flavisolibacter sp.]|nr:outer membrane beta-barrel protein [Flavisolibacter sp.]
MKKKLLVLGAAAFICSTSLMAQTTSNAGRTTFGLRGGVNFSTFNGEDASGNDLDNKIATGFNVGLNAEIPVGTGSYIQPGVLFSTKGTEYQNGAEVNLSYVEIPVNFV